jgi:hypothetical protein
VPITGVGRLGVSALLLAAVAACGPADDPRPAGAAAAAPSYEAPDDAPGFCTRLAAVGGLERLPASMGALLGGTDVEARTQVSRVVRDLRAVLAGVHDEGGHEEVATALEDLVRALGSVVDRPFTGPVADAVSAALGQVGAQAQPACGFPA